MTSERKQFLFRLVMAAVGSPGASATEDPLVELIDRSMDLSRLIETPESGRATQAEIAHVLHMKLRDLVTTYRPD